VVREAGYHAPVYACGEVELCGCEETDSGYVGVEEGVQAGVDIARRGASRVWCEDADCEGAVVADKPVLVPA